MEIERLKDYLKVLNLTEGDLKDAELPSALEHLVSRFNLYEFPDPEDLKRRIEPLHLLKLQYKVRSNPTFRNAFRYNLTEIFLLSMAVRIAQGKNVIFQIHGETGSGKSYSALSIAGFLDKLGIRFDVNHIFWRIEDVISSLRRFEGKETIMQDEMPMQSGIGVGSDRINAVMWDLLETIRKKQICFLFLAPTVRKSVTVAHYVLEPFLIDRDNEIAFLALKLPYRVWGGYYVVGSILVPHPKYVVGEKLVEEYERKKDWFLDAYVLQKGGTNRIAELAETIMNDPSFNAMLNAYLSQGRKLSKSLIKDIVITLSPYTLTSTELDQIVSVVYTHVTVGRFVKKERS